MSNLSLLLSIALLALVSCSKMDGPEQFEAGLADAKIDAERGALICTALSEFIMPGEIFGNKSLHGKDWAAYYMNIRVNAKKRAEAFVGHEIQ